MGKFSGKYHAIKKMSQEQIDKWSQELIILLKYSINSESKYVEEYVDQLRRLNPGIENMQLANKIIKRRSWKAAGIGAVTGLGGFITMPVTMPVELYTCYKIQARMVLSIAYMYGWNIYDDDVITDVLLVIGGNAAKDGLKEIGIKAGQEFAKKAVKNFMTKDIMAKINKVISRKIITKAGEKSLTSFTKLVPVVAAPIGAGFDGFGTLAIGRTALKFYKG